MEQTGVQAEAGRSQTPRSISSGVLQRQCACGIHTMGGGECAECQKTKMGVGGRPLQAKLAISEPGDAYEQEADRVAEQVMRMSPTDVSRRQKSGMLQPLVQRRASSSATGLAEAPPSVHEVLGSSGQPLRTQTRALLEPRFGHDFSQVRVHTDGAAECSAREVSAHAYTVGHHVVFGRGKYSSDTPAGRYLIAHELAHVVQQRGAMSIVRRQAEAEAATPVMEDDSLTSRITREAIREVSLQAAGIMRRGTPIPIPETILAAVGAAMASFLYRMYERLIEQGEGLTILSRMRELLNPLTLAEFYLRYLWGLLKGLVSPITGLVHLAIGSVRFFVAATEWLNTLPSHAPALIEEAAAIRASMEAFGTRAEATLSSLRNREGLLEFAGAIFGAASSLSGGFERTVVDAAQRQGERAANSLVRHFLTTPLPELAETVGEIIGTVVIELILLLFTEGIGNLITRLGEFARALAPLSRGVRAFTGVAIEVGRIITQIEHMIGVLMSRTVLRPVMPLLEALQPLLARMQRFAQRLIGVGEESTLALARAGSGAVGEVGSAARVVDRPPVPGTTPSRPASGVTTAAPTSVTTPSTPTRVAPPSEPPVPLSGVPRSRRPVRGATAEGTGEAFRYEYHPESPTPVVETRRARRGRPEHVESSVRGPREPLPAWQEEYIQSLVDDAADAGLLDHLVEAEMRATLAGDRAAIEAHLRARLADRSDDEVTNLFERLERSLDVASETVRATEGTGRGARSPSAEEELNASPEARAVGEDEVEVLSPRYANDRFDANMTEEDLAEIAQELFPNYRYDPATRGRITLHRGRPVAGRRRPPGSTIPDLYLRGGRASSGVPRRPPISLEAKNYFLGTEDVYEEFLLAVTRQARQRTLALPRTAEQHLLIDLRGQEVTRAFVEGLRRDLVARSGGILRFERIHFLPRSLE